MNRLSLLGDSPFVIPGRNMIHSVCCLRRRRSAIQSFWIFFESSFLDSCRFLFMLGRNWHVKCMNNQPERGRRSNLSWLSLFVIGFASAEPPAKCCKIEYFPRPVYQACLLGFQRCRWGGYVNVSVTWPFPPLHHFHFTFFAFSFMLLVSPRKSKRVEITSRRISKTKRRTRDMHEPIEVFLFLFGARENDRYRPWLQFLREQTGARSCRARITDNTHRPHNFLWLDWFPNGCEKEAFLRFPDQELGFRYTNRGQVYQWKAGTSYQEVAQKGVGRD